MLDVVFCDVLSTSLINQLKAGKKQIVRQKGRQLQQGAHKGPIRIDTPPPSIDAAASSIFYRQKSITSKKHQITLLSEHYNTNNRMLSKSKTLYPKFGSRA